MTDGRRRQQSPLSFREALFAQAENLEAARSAASDALAGDDLRALREGVLILTGMGASLHALTPAVEFLRRAGRRAFAVPATELAEGRAKQLGDAFVVVSQSGASSETLAAFEELEDRFVVAISAHGESALARSATLWLPLGPIPDTPVATLSYTATLQALALLAHAILDIKSRWERLPELVGQMLSSCEADARRLAERFREIRALDAIGGGASYATASETALLAREGLLITASGLETRQYLHGPLEAAGSGLGCLLFGSGREISLARSLVEYGAEVGLITDRPADVERVKNVIAIPPVDELAIQILEILPVQLMAGHLAELRGLEIGTLRRQQADTKVV